MDWSQKKVLVTGAAGFIGSHLTEKLVELGANVRVFVRYNSRNDRGFIDTFSEDIKKNLEIYTGDLKDPDAVHRATTGCDVVFNLGALIAIPYSYVNPMDFVQTNVEGTANVLNACIKNEVGHLIQTSTSEVYGQIQYAPIDENHPITGKSPYAASKIGSDMMAMSYHYSFGLPVSIVRPFNTYGPRQSERAIIPTIIRQALHNNELHLGSLHPTRDFNYVKDTVSGFIMAATTKASIGETINLGTGREVSIGDLAKTIMNVVGRELPIISDDNRIRPEKSEVNRLICDATKAKKLLEWQPRYTLEMGIEETINWIRTTMPELKKQAEYVI